MIGDLIKSIQQALDERVTNPLPGAFVIAWLAFNWKLVAIILFGGESVKERFTLLESQPTGVLHVLVIPLGIAVAYIAVMPWIAFGIQKYSLWVNNRRTLHKLNSESKLFDARTKHAKDKYNAEAHAFVQTKAMEDLREKYASEAHDLHIKISELESENRRLERQRDAYRRTEEMSEEDLQQENHELTQQCEDLNNRLTKSKDHAETYKKAVQQKDKELKECREQLKRKES